MWTKIRNFQRTSIPHQVRISEYRLQPTELKKEKPFLLVARSEYFTRKMENVSKRPLKAFRSWRGDYKFVVVARTRTGARRFAAPASTCLQITKRNDRPASLVCNTNVFGNRVQVVKFLAYLPVPKNRWVNKSVAVRRAFPPVTAA